jgi:glycosyltransferase involved in cell wall biosynthesis
LALLLIERVHLGRFLKNDQTSISKEEYWELNKEDRFLGCTTQPIPHTGGASTHLLNLQEAISRVGIYFDIFALNDVPLASRLLGNIKAGIIHESLGIAKAIDTTVSLYRKYLRICIEMNRPTVLSVQSIHAMLACMDIRQTRSIPKILTVHGYVAYEAESAGIIKNSREHETLIDHERTAFDMADIILTVDTRIRKHILELMPGCEHKVHVWPNSPGHKFIEEIKGIDRTVARIKIGIPAGAYMVLCPRRLVPKNGVYVPIRALKHLDKEKDIIICYAGDGPLRANLEKSLQDDLRRRVIFFGNIKHGLMPYYYRASDVVVIPSIPDKGVEEATSISALEAAVSGVPIIVTDIGGLREIFIGTESAIIIPPNNDEVLAQSIMRLKNDRAYSQWLGDQALNLVHKRYSPDIWAQDYLSYSEQALARYE